MQKKKSSRYPKRVVTFDGFDADFVDEVSSKRRIGKDYKYRHKNPLWHACAFILYRMIVFPIAFLYCKIALRQKIIGRKKLKGHRSYVLYCMHNEPVGDAMTPSQVAFPKKAHVVIHPDNVALPIVGRILPMLGGLPTPTDLGGIRSYIRETSAMLSRGAVITVYPEAHVWPRCTFVRPFRESAFDLAVRSGVASFSVTRVYKRSRLFGFKCRLYVDGPFYPTAKSGSVAREELSELVHSSMEARAKENELEIISYVQVEKNNG